MPHQTKPVDDPISDRQSEFAEWSIVPILLKPDALAGECTTVSGKVAADFAVYLRAAIDGLQVPEAYSPLVQASKVGAERACEHARGESRVLAWYKLPLRSVSECQQRLDVLQALWFPTPYLNVADVLSDACRALGFEAIMVRDEVLSDDHYMAIYGEVGTADDHRKMRPFFVGKTVRLILLCGQQENSALQILKTYARHVMRYPLAKVRMENWIHVTNADASNYPELLRLYVGNYSWAQHGRRES